MKKKSMEKHSAFKCQKCGALYTIIFYNTELDVKYFSCPVCNAQAHEIFDIAVCEVDPDEAYK